MPISIIFHEYTHLLVENTFENAPVWFNEGLAEYYSTFSITDDQNVVVGNPGQRTCHLLRDKKMLPLRTLFEVDYKSAHYNEKNKQSIFYAQSWALMHYLLVGKEGKACAARKVYGTARFKHADGTGVSAGLLEFRSMRWRRSCGTTSSRIATTASKGHFAKKLELDTTTLRRL